VRTLRLPIKELHKINSMMGFHPRMAALAQLYKDGYLSIIQGVGYPNSDRSHEGAMRIWHTADPDRPNRQAGWLGRVADSVWNPHETNAPVVFVGPIAQPFALNAENVVVPSNLTHIRDCTYKSQRTQCHCRFFAILDGWKPDMLLKMSHNST
jgi:uncharacterized protein (DUF1501 family)